MSLIFERIYTPGIAQLSYLLGDDATGAAAVIDPRPEVDVYLQLARRYGLAISHIFETHIHADFMSGSRTLAQRLGSAAIYVSGEEEAEYGFSVEKISDGAQFEFGETLLTARHTPGHTPEHIAFEVAEKDSPKKPWGVFTGDSLFTGSAGRPDLLGDDQTEELIEQLFHTLRDYYLKLEDGVALLPCHGAGSACGADIGDRPLGTIGYERRTNPFLAYEDLEEFRRFVTEGAPPEPHHYKHLKQVNAEGPPVVDRPPTIPALPPAEFREAAAAKGVQLVDTRQMLAFGGGHIAGAVNIGPRPELSVWAGQMLKHERPVLLVLEEEESLEKILWLFVNTGFTKFAGYLAGGMKAWENAAEPLETLPQITVHALNERREEMQILAVRAPAEWEEGRIPGARHYYVAEMREGINGVAGLDRKKPLAVYCASGYRSSIAASLLKRSGFAEVHNVPGAFMAWKEAGYEVEK